MALITTWWYTAASAAPVNGPTQKIHWHGIQTQALSNDENS
jgi:hypothetical protein